MTRRTTGIPVLDDDPRNAYPGFLGFCERHGVADLDGVREVFAAATLGEMSPVEEWWYASLAAGEPDYGIYGADAYLGDCWASWHLYSRKYLRTLVRWLRKGGSPDEGCPASAVLPVRRVADLGCGCGWTTAALRALFPDATVVGTNVEDTPQWRVARAKGAEEGFAVVDLLRSAGDHLRGPADLVFASEYLEHFQAPRAHLRSVIDELAPRVLVVASSFSQPAAGHFPEYRIGGGAVPGRQVNRLLGTALRQRGYRTPGPLFWNNRPAIWLRK